MLAQTNKLLEPLLLFCGEKKKFVRSLPDLILKSTTSPSVPLWYLSHPLLHGSITGTWVVAHVVVQVFVRCHLHVSRIGSLIWCILIWMQSSCKHAHGPMDNPHPIFIEPSHATPSPGSRVTGALCEEVLLQITTCCFFVFVFWTSMPGSLLNGRFCCPGCISIRRPTCTHLTGGCLHDFIACHMLPFCA